MKLLQCTPPPPPPHTQSNNHNPTSNIEGNNIIRCDNSSSTDQVYVNKLIISEISLSETGNAISKLESGKSASTDKIANEVITCLPDNFARNFSIYNPPFWGIPHQMGRARASSILFSNQEN